MQMNISSRISNQTTIYYAKRNGHEIARPRGDQSSSPRKKKNSKPSTTKQWVQKSFYTTTKLPRKNTASVFSDISITMPPKTSVSKSNDPNKLLEKSNPDQKTEPAVYFEESGVNKGAEKFKFCLVGKFTGPKPSLEKIREWAGKEWKKLEGDWSITSLDRNHVFVRLENEADMIRIWPRNRWFVGEHLMKVFKWQPTFRASYSEGEPSLAAVWISFPQLPVVFFQEAFLYKISSLVGKVFCMDEPTRKLSRTSMARVCVEVDLVKELPKRLWIGIGKKGFWQDVCYESLPSYCTNCLQQGHPTRNCRLEKVAAMADAPQPNVENLSFNYKKIISGFKVKKFVANRKNQYNTCPVFLYRDEKETLLSRCSHRRLLLNRSASLHSRNIISTKGAKKGRNEGKIQQNAIASVTNKKPLTNAISSSEQNDSANGLKGKPSEETEKVEQNLSANETTEDLVSFISTDIPKTIDASIHRRIEENGNRMLDAKNIFEVGGKYTLDVDAKGKGLATTKDMGEMAYKNTQQNQLDAHEQMSFLEKGQPLSKFGEWDVNDPASAEGFTVIFNKSRDKKKTGGNTRGADSPLRDDTAIKPGIYANKTSSLKGTGIPTQVKSPESEPANIKKKFLFNKTIFFWRRKQKKVPGGKKKTSNSTDLLYANTTTVASKPTGARTSRQSSLVVNPCRHFSMAEIKNATQNFDHYRVIGDGGFGRVYKGVIDGGTEVAIKRGNSSSKQGMTEFQTEIDMLSRLRHRHLVALFGVCTDNDERMLVYDFMSRGSLRDILYSEHKDPLSWKRRVEICTGAARGLHYLHSNGIIHRDVKTTNILVDKNWDAKVADFGVSKEGPADDETHISTNVKGTPGYLDPGYIMTGHVTIKSDIYSLGVVLLEVLFGRPPVDRSLPSNQSNLINWAQQCHKRGTLDTSIDPHLRGNINPKFTEKFAVLALLCVQYESDYRPGIELVLKVLEGLLAKASAV